MFDPFLEQGYPIDRESLLEKKITLTRLQFEKDFIIQYNLMFIIINGPRPRSSFWFWPLILWKLDNPNLEHYRKKIEHSREFWAFQEPLTALEMSSTFWSRSF